MGCDGLSGEWVSDWRDPHPAAVPGDFLPTAHRVLREILWRRGHTTEAGALALLDPFLYRLPAQPLGEEMAIAIARIESALRSGERFGLWGDYDADGQTAVAVLMEALLRCGASVRYQMGDYLSEHRGLTEAGLRALAADGCRIVITCDCGTNDVDGATLARALGLELIVTDHHQQLGPLPEALAVINSTLVASDDPCWGLPGAGVAFLLARGLLRAAGHAAEADSLLDLVSLGAVADVAQSTPVLRAMLVRGLPRLWGGARPGIRALLERAGREPEALDTDAISYVLGPVLNAAGKSGSPADGVALLLARSAAEAEPLAERLWELRGERRLQAAALERLVETAVAETGMAEMPAIVVAGLGWHRGLLGRVAVSTMRRHGRPAAALLSVPTEGEIVRGSARAAGELDLLAMLRAAEPYLLHYGGHRHAAGFSLRSADIECFRSAFLQAVAEHLLSLPSDAGLQVDAHVSWGELTVANAATGALVDALWRLAPFCAGNPTPVLATYDMEVTAIRRFGADGRHARLTLRDRAGSQGDITWWQAPEGWQAPGRIDVAYTVARERWRGNLGLQLTLQGVRPHREPVQGVA